MSAKLHEWEIIDEDDLDPAQNTTATRMLLPTDGWRYRFSTYDKDGRIALVSMVYVPPE